MTRLDRPAKPLQRSPDQRTSRIADHRAPQREVLHPPGVVGDLNGVAHNVLVFEHDVEARDHIANERLRSEAHSEAGETRKSYRRCDIDIEFVQGRQQRHDPDNLAPRAIKDSRQRARLLFAQLRRAALSCRLLDNQIGYRAQQAV